MRLHSSKKASLADCCFQAVDIVLTNKETKTYQCQCILCGTVIQGFRNDVGGSGFKLNDDHLKQHLKLCHNASGSLISLYFISFDNGPYLPDILR